MSFQTTNSAELSDVPLFWDELHPELYGGKSLTKEERIERWNESGTLPINVVINAENHPPQSEEEDDVKIVSNSMEEFIQNYDKDNLSPYVLKAELSGQYNEFAKENIIRFFKENLNFVIYGYTSSSFRSLILYRSTDGVLYSIHTWMGEYNKAYYFTRSEMLKYFEDDDMNIPDWEESHDIKVKSENGLMF